jgi:histidinol-phosphate aminotransferase
MILTGEKSVFDIQKIARPCILERKEYIPGKPIEEVQREFGITDIIKMASNENPLGTSPKALAAMTEELKNTNYYPESLCHDLVIKLADRLGVNTNQLFIDNGEDGVITMLGLTFINPGDEVIFGEVSFPAYENITGKMDGTGIPVPLTPDYRLDVDGIINAISPKTKMIFLCNPNNPTGTIITNLQFDQLINAAPDNVLIISDEAYFEFADDPAYPQTLPYLESHPNLIILRTFSKIMGLAAVRIGYAVAHESIIKTMLKAREPFPVNRLAQAGALASLDDDEFIQRSIEVVQQGRKQLEKAFIEMGMDCYTGQTNFVFVDIGQPAKPVFDALLREGIIIRPCGPLGAPNCIRVTIGTEHQNDRFIRSFKKSIIHPTH